MSNPYAQALSDSGLTGEANDVGGQIHLLLTTLRDSYTGNFTGANYWTEVKRLLQASAGRSLAYQSIEATLTTFEMRASQR